MGYFRRFKPSDYSSAECAKEMAKIILLIRTRASTTNADELGQMIEQWACFRELLARHENQNASPLDPV